MINNYITQMKSNTLLMLLKIAPVLLLIFALIAGVSSAAFGQSSANETITASANIIQGVSVGDDTQNLKFGNILQDTGKIVLATDGSVDASAAGTGGSGDGITGGEQRGYVSIESTADTNIRVLLTLPTQLLHSNGSNTLSIQFSTTGTNFNLNGMVSANKPTGEETITALAGSASGNWTFQEPNGTWNTTQSPSFVMPEGGKAYMVLGAEVVAGRFQALGTYTGDIVVTASILN